MRRMIVAGALLTVCVLLLVPGTGECRKFQNSMLVAAGKGQNLDDVTKGHLKDAEKFFIKAKHYEAEGNQDLADQSFKKGIIALSKAEEKAPGSTEVLAGNLSAAQKPSTSNEQLLSSSIVRRNTNPIPVHNIELMRSSRSSRSSYSSRGNDSRSSYSRSKDSRSSRDSGSADKGNSDYGKADEERRKLDKDYDRAKKGSKVLGWGLKILNKIPVVKNFIPDGAEQTAEAADKMGNKLSGPKDGTAIINGELKVWNSRAGKWEDF